MRRTLILAGVSAVLVAGCGDANDDKPVGPDTADAVAVAAKKTAQQTSAKMEITGTGKVSGQTLKITGSGITQFKPPATQLGMDTSAAGQSIHIDMVAKGSTMYMKLPSNLGANLPNGASWLKIDVAKALDNPQFASVMNSGSDPTQYLKLLQVSGGAKRVGGEQIDGRNTTHYTASVDYRKLAQSGPPEFKSIAQQSLKFAADPVVPVDVWIDDQGLMRREKLHIKTKSIAGAPAQDQTMQIDITDYGVDTSGIQAPADSDSYDVTDETKQALSGAGVTP